MSSIRKKLLTSFFAIITALLISEAFFIAMDYIILSKYMNLSDNMISEYKIIEDSSSLIISFNKRIKSPSDKVVIDNFNFIYSDLKNLLTKLRAAIIDSESNIVFSGLENNINDILFNVEIGIANLDSGNYLEAISRYDIVNQKNSFVKENVTDLLLKELEYAKIYRLKLRRLG